MNDGQEKLFAAAISITMMLAIGGGIYFWDAIFNTAPSSPPRSLDEVPSEGANNNYTPRLRMSDDGYSWAKASRAERMAVCEQLARLWRDEKPIFTWVTSEWLYNSVQGFYTGPDRSLRSMEIREVAALAATAEDGRR